MAVSQIDNNGVNLGQLGNRNLIINGAMQVAQRGTSQTSSSYGSVDRWYIYSSGGTFTQNTSSPPEGFSHYLTCTSATGSFIISQAIELPATGSAGVFYNGQTITISYYAKSTSAGDALYNPMSFRNGATSITDLVSVESDSSDTNVLTTSWARYSKTYTIGVSPHANNTCLVIQPRTSDAPSGDISITGVQLEAGDTATPFEHRSYGQELALCQRYYQNSWGQYGSKSDQTQWQGPSNNGVTTTSWITAPLEFKVEMRVNPSMTSYDNAGTSGKWTRSTWAVGSDDNQSGGFTVIRTHSAVAYSDSSANRAHLQGNWQADAEL